MAPRDRRPRRSDLARHGHALAAGGAEPLQADAPDENGPPAARKRALRVDRLSAVRPVDKRPGRRQVRSLANAQRALSDLTGDILERCRRAMHGLERSDPVPRDPEDPRWADNPPPGSKLPSGEVLSWYKEASRVILGMTDAQLQRERIDASRKPTDAPASGDSDGALIASLIEAMPADALRAELARRGKPIDVDASERPADPAPPTDAPADDA